MKFIKKNLVTTILIVFFTILPVISFAQGNNPPGGGNTPPPVQLTNPIAAKSIQEFMLKLLEGVIKIGIPIIVLAVIYSGFLFVKARGNPEEITKAKDALLYTLIGSAILLGALAIATLIKETVVGLSA